MGRLRAMCAQSVPPQSCLSGGGGDACRAAPRCSVLGTAACEGANWRGVCRGLGAARPQPQLGCTHPACARVAEASAAESGQFSLNCVWSPRLKAVSGRSDAYCAHSLLPWAARGELNASVMDFTPNYICDADAMARIHDSAAERPEAVKFIVVIRDPVARAFSEWSMFALGSLRYRERGQDTARAFASHLGDPSLQAGTGIRSRTSRRRWRTSCRRCRGATAPSTSTSAGGYARGDSGGTVISGENLGLISPPLILSRLRQLPTTAPAAHLRQ